MRLHRGVHILQRQRQQHRRHARPSQSRPIQIGIGAALCGGNLQLHMMRLRAVLQPFQQLRLNIRAHAGREAVQVHRGIRTAPGDRGVIHVNGDRQIGINMEGRRLCALRTDLLLRGADKVHIRVALETLAAAPPSPAAWSHKPGRPWSWRRTGRSAAA